MEEDKTRKTVEGCVNAWIFFVILFIGVGGFIHLIYLRCNPKAQKEHEKTEQIINKNADPVDEYYEGYDGEHANGVPR